MSAFLATLLGCSVAMSAISLVYMAVLPYLSKRYSATWLYYIWMVVITGWVFPFWPHLKNDVFPLQIPKFQILQAKQIEIDESIILASGINQTSFIPLWWIIAGIWGICTVGIIAQNAWRHKRFLSLVNRWGEAVTHPQTLTILDSLRTDMKIRKQVGLMTCSFLTSPMMVGFFRPVILLPAIQMDADEMTFILRHELIHFKRHDLWYKSLVLLTTAIHWFNPVVYFIAKAIEEQCEMSCDEVVVRKTSLEQRKRYSETIIGLIRKGTKVKTSLSTNFYREGNRIKTRIFRIMDGSKKKAGIAVLFIALLTIMGARMVFAFNPANNGQEMMQQAHNKQVIQVDIKKLESKEMASLGGTYTLKAGDVIRYDILTETGSQDFTIKFFRENNQRLGIKETWMVVPEHGIEVTQDQTGSYYLIIYNKLGEPLSNIKGTIEIIK